MTSREAIDPPPAPLRRGRLNNGNPPGDICAAPRCGARTRAGHACRQPAMRNGRCRLHGGKSTGARTPEGQARVRRARLRHGARSAEAIALTAAAMASARRIARLIAVLRTLSPGGGPAGHGVGRSNRPASPGGAAGGGARPPADLPPADPSQAARMALPSGPTDGGT